MNDLPQRDYANEAERNARENPPHAGELQRETDELKAALTRTWVYRLLLKACDGIVRLDATWQRRKSRT